MAEMKQNLPFRPLEVRGHGVWDPERKAFYPFKVANSSIVCPTGKRIFVHAVNQSAQNSGDAGATICNVNGHVDGSIVYFVSLYLPATVAASNVNVCNSISATIDVLCDSGKNVSESLGTASASNCHIVYAEIPDDISGQ